MKKFIKIFVSLAIIIFIFRFVETVEVSKTLQLLSAGPLCLMIGIYFISQIISAYKWYLINQEFGLKSGFKLATSAYLTGMFVNSYGLGIVGGDLTRALLIAPESKKMKALASVFVDRLHGMLILGLIGCLGYFAWSNHFNATIQYAILPLLVAFPIISILWFFFAKFILFFIPKKFNLNVKLGQAINYFQGRKKHLLIISATSAAMHLIQIFLLYLVGVFIGAEIPFHTLLVVIPFVNIITSLPFSWNGLGVREAAFIFFLSDYIHTEQAVSLGLVWLVTVTINSLIGGLFWLLNKPKIVAAV
ncbi:MAG: lysylphosphatidylglycerol synthase transmembrane domain-containing protein [Candidatus Paceibacterota bacterium]